MGLWLRAFASHSGSQSYDGRAAISWKILAQKGCKIFKESEMIDSGLLVLPEMGVRHF